MFKPSSLVVLPALLAAAPALAFDCHATEYESCVWDLGTVRVHFDAGIGSFDGDSQINGTDGYVVGYTVGTNDFPALTAVDTAGGTQAGFSFAPPMLGVVGGSGFEGEHEAYADFYFAETWFEAAPGWRIDAIVFTVAGAATQAGDGYVYLDVPGAPVFSGQSFVASALRDPTTTYWSASFSAWAPYEEGEVGTAAVFGTAMARFDAVSIVALVSAVPEPGSAWLGLAGLVALARRRRR